jgi:hypothetical protein
MAREQSDFSQPDIFSAFDLVERKWRGNVHDVNAIGDWLDAGAVFLNGSKWSEEVRVMAATVWSAKVAEQLKINLLSVVNYRQESAGCALKNYILPEVHRLRNPNDDINQGSIWVSIPNDVVIQSKIRPLEGLTMVVGLGAGINLLNETGDSYLNGKTGTVLDVQARFLQQFCKLYPKMDMGPELRKIKLRALA